MRSACVVWKGGAGVQSPTNAGARASCPALALVRVGTRNGGGCKHVQSHFGVKNFEFAIAAVDDILDAIEGERRFCYVGGDDDLKCRRGWSEGRSSRSCDARALALRRLSGVGKKIFA